MSTYEEFIAQILELDDKQLAEMLDRRHPLYKALLPHWDFLEKTYEGGREWFEDNIFKFYKEGATEYKERVERAYRPNHSRECVDLVNKYIFKSTISRRLDDAPEHVKSFWLSSTVHRRAIDDLMRLLSAKSSIFGRVWCVVDSNAPDDVVTLADVKDGQARVYAYVVKPQNALDFSFDDNGDLEWILLQESHRDGDLFTGTGKVSARYRLWSTLGWVLFSELPKKVGGKTRYQIEDFGPNNVGVVPVFPVDHKVDDDLWTASGLLDDVAYLDRAVANYLSNIDAIIQDQTFSQLVIPAQAVMPGDEGDDKILEMGTKRMFTYDAQAGIAPQYIAPDPRQANLILSVVNKIIAEIYQTVGMSGERTKQDNATGIDNSSGVAKAYDFERMNALLAAKASSLEHAENRIVGLVRLYNGDGKPTTVFNADKLVVYPGNFDVRSLYDEFEIASQLSMMGAPDEVRQQQMITLIDKLFPGLAKQLVEKLKKAVVEDWPVNPIEAAAELAEAAAGGTEDAPADKNPPKPKAASKQGQNNKDAKED